MFVCKFVCKFEGKFVVIKFLRSQSDYVYNLYIIFFLPALV